MSIVTLEKPVAKVAESDWYYKVYELKESCDNHRLNAFGLRNESHRLRNDTDVTTCWDTHRTNSNIVDRYVFSGTRFACETEKFYLADELKSYAGKI